MAVALPANGVATASPRFIDRGGVLRAALGGPDQRLDRLGSRFGLDVQLKPMKADDARIWIARLIRGMRERATIRFPQPGLAASGDLTSAAAAAANAESISVSGATASANEGRFISFIVGGRHYVHQIKSTSGSPIGIQPPLRVSVASGLSIKLNPASVTIEGYVLGDPMTWTIDQAKIYGLAFSLEESA